MTQQATKRNIAVLNQFVTSRERIIALDPATGRTIRTVTSRTTPTYFPIRISPGGEWLLLSGGPGTLERISTRSGSVRGVVPIGGMDSQRRFGGRDIVGFTRDGRGAYVVHGDPSLGAKTRIVEWDLATDRLTTILETDAYAEPAAPTRVSTRRAALIPGDAPAFVLAPSFKESYDTGRYTIWVHTPSSDPEVRAIPVEVQHLSTAYPVVSPDGARLFLGAMSHGVLGIDLATGESLGHVRPDYLLETGLDELLLSDDGDLLFFPVIPGTVLVRSLPDRRWIARLSTADLIGPNLAASPDGRWLSLVGFKPGAPRGGPYLHELLIYDLSTLQPDPSPSPPP